MWRSFLKVLLAAALGGFTATLIFPPPLGAPGLVSVLGMSLLSMLFSLPGAAMLLGFEAILHHRGWSEKSSYPAVLTIGALAGGASLGLISVWDGRWTATGALFALTTGTMLLLIERLWVSTPRLERGPARLWAVAGAGLLALMTLGMLPI